MSKYVYLFNNSPGSEDTHLEFIDHACAMASLYNDVIIIFSQDAVLNLNCNDKRANVYKSLAIFGIQQFIIDRDYANKYKLKIDSSIDIKLLSIAEYEQFIKQADVVF